MVIDSCLPSNWEGANKKRICFVIPGFGDGGAQKQCALLLREFSLLDIYEIHLIFFYDGQHFDILKDANVVFHKKKVGSMWSLGALAHVFVTINKIKPDLVFSWLHSCDVFSFVAKFIFGSFVWVMAERDSYYPPEFRYWLRSKCAKFSDAIICNSKKGVDYWRQKIKKNNNIFVCRNIVSLPSFSSVSSPHVSPVDFLYVGRLEPQKNIMFLADIFDLLVRKHGFSCLVIGDGSLRQELDVGFCNSKESFSVMSFKKNIFDFYSNAKVFVSLSLHEGTPNTVVENIALGNRVVVTNIQEHVDILGLDYPYFVDKNGSANDAIEVLLRAFKDPVNSSDYVYARDVLHSMRKDSVLDGYRGVFDRLLGSGAV